MGKLEDQNQALHDVLKAVEKAIYSVKVPQDHLGSQDYLDKIHADLEPILNLHYDKLQIMGGYITKKRKVETLYNELDEIKKKDEKDTDGESTDNG